MYKQNQRRARHAWTVGVIFVICLLVTAGYGARVLAKDGAAPETPASFPGMMSYQGKV
jgi:hypothetical protein